MILKEGSGDVRGIGLVEVIRKAVLVILNCHLGGAITFHDAINGFQDGLEMRTPPLRPNYFRS